MLDYLVREATQRLRVRRLVLFGSRARGDARSDSDFDVAIEHDSDHATWSDFVCLVQEQAPTLLDIELVDSGRASESIRAAVDRDGRVLYG